VDRLNREGALETLQYLNQLSTYGIGLRSFTEPYLDSCGIFKDAVIAILGAIAKQERVRVSNACALDFKGHKAQGTKTGRPVGRPKAVFRRDQVADLRRQGKSWRQIAAECRAGVTTVRRAYAAQAVGESDLPKDGSGVLAQ
jgi:DNA invertase Pin-like site-specific DNA recombinase